LRYGRLTGTQAWEMGWANYAVPAHDVLPLAHELAEEIGRTPRDTITVKKAAMNYVLDNEGYRRVIEAAGIWGTLAHGGLEVAERDAHLDEVGLRAALREDAEIRARHVLLNRVTGLNVPTPSERPEQKTPVQT
jgi:enoyl-CoA hydratase